MPCFVPCMCDCTWFCFQLADLFFHLSLLVNLADRPGLSQATSISGALWELGVALCWGNASLYRSDARSSRREMLAGPLCAVLPGPEVV
jgi:hypothetical protein